jgi:chromate reductase, NAD(P)H dehydrogenase (quinone)
MRIEIISGSPRAKTVTYRLALFIQRLLQERSEHEVGIIDLREHNLPLLETVFTSVADTPQAYKKLSERMFSTNAFILVTPEYNGSYTPAMKNLLDHFPKQSRKAFGIATASQGSLGGIRAAISLQQLVFALFGIGSPYMLVTPHVDKKFDEEGHLLDSSFQKSADVFINEFLWLAEKVVDEQIEA